MPNIICPDHEARAAALGTLGLLVRPVPEEPYRCPWGAWAWLNNGVLHEWADSDWTEAEVLASIAEHAPYAPGDVLGVREAVRFVGASLSKRMCEVEYRDGEKRLLNEVPTVMIRELGRRITPQHMPAWAVRSRLRVVAVECRQVGSITEEEAAATGVSARWLVDELRPLADKADPWPPHWLCDGPDQSISLCLPCAKKRLRKEREEFPDAQIDGGWSTECDGVELCDECGRLLDYTLTGYGIESELEHFAEYGIVPCADAAHEAHRALCADGFPLTGDGDSEFDAKMRPLVARVAMRWAWDRRYARVAPWPQGWAWYVKVEKEAL